MERLSLSKTYHKKNLLLRHAEMIIFSEIIRICELKKWSYMGYPGEFVSEKTGVVINDNQPCQKRITRLIHQFETEMRSAFDKQLYYSPEKWRKWHPRIVNYICTVRRNYLHKKYL